MLEIPKAIEMKPAPHDQAIDLVGICKTSFLQ